MGGKKTSYTTRPPGRRARTDVRETLQRILVQVRNGHGGFLGLNSTSTVGWTDNKSQEII
jgi:hypothetical protein